MPSAAVLAFDGRCRLLLERGTPGRTAGWLMANPSRADAEVDDPTANRVVQHSARAGCGRVLVGNVNPLRTPYPADLWRMIARGDYTDAMYEANLDALAAIGAQCDVLFVAFGAEPARRYPRETRAAYDAFTNGRDALCLGMTLDGMPLHPLARGKHAVRNDVVPTPWDADRYLLVSVA